MVADFPSRGVRPDGFDYPRAFMSDPGSPGAATASWSHCGTGPPAVSLQGSTESSASSAAPTSMGRTVQCRDNSMAESFFAAPKNECVYRTVYATKTHARHDIFDTSRDSTILDEYIQHSTTAPRTTSTTVTDSTPTRLETNHLQCPKSSRQIRPPCRLTTRKL
jgi:hypothetical protein